RMRRQEAGFKIATSSTGFVRLSFPALRDAGLDGPVPFGELVLSEAWFVEDHPENPLQEEVIPFLAEDGDGDGELEPGDALVFFAQDRWDRFDQAPRDRRYGREHVYWLRRIAGGDPGAQMDEQESWHGWTGMTNPGTVRLAQTAERDSIYTKPVTRAEETGWSPAEGTLAIESTHLFWTDPGPGEKWAFFSIPDGSQLVEVRVEMQGAFRVSSPNPHTPNLYLSNQPLGAEPWWPFPGNPYVISGKNGLTITVDSDQLAGFESVSEPDSMAVVVDLPVSGYGACLNRIHLTYDRPYRASLGHFRFHTGGLSGQQEFLIEDFDSSDILAFEVTDSLGPAHLPLVPEQIEGGAGGFDVRLQLELGDGADVRTFVLVERDRIADLPAHAVRLREPADLAAGGSHDYVAVFYDGFAEALEPLLVHRESQGHEVLRAPAEDVYDVFNGGRKSPVAIRNFLRYLFRQRVEAPAYLLLVGDASDDYAGADEDSDFNYLPTVTLPSNAHDQELRELVAHDSWFVDNVAGSGEELDFYPDMHIGRLPAGSESELAIMVSKIIRYEDTDDETPWRNRGIFLADDFYSERVSGYGYQSSELVFERGSRELIRYIYEDAGLADFEADSFFLALHLDSLRTLGRCWKDTAGVPYDPCSPQLADQPCLFNEDGRVTNCCCPEYELSRDQGDAGGRPGPLALELIESLNRGGLFWNVESHANARLITHEYVFQNAPRVREDVLRIQNRNRPFIFFGFGCHLAEFSAHDEGNFRKKDCISEWLLFHGSQDVSLGAVSAFASTAYEWLHLNDILHQTIFQAFFVDPPEVEGESAWILGDVLTRGKVTLLGDSPSGSEAGQVLTYTHLGDPALKVDIAPPRLAVEVEGDPVEEGVALVAPDPSDSLRVAVRVRDEVAVGELAVEDRGGPLPPEQITIEQEPGEDRSYRARFDLELQADDYSVVLRTQDRMGRERSFLMMVELDAQFFQLTEDGDELPLQADDLVSGASHIVVYVGAPVYLGEDELTAFVDEEPWDGELVLLDDGVDGEARRWKYVSPQVGLLDDGRHAFRLEIGEGERSIDFFTSPPGELRLTRLFNFPNPFDESTAFHYWLTDFGARARIRIYTLRGQLIRTFDNLPAAINENISPVWDGRDADGDPVANGVYFYKFEVWDQSGEKIERIERLARTQ
ncbi:MAG: hypothetical protein GF355_14650, partial [Candidatus Eisenbacteria bacterium]|nr:hypothetical protein [Candidatus Eisenbacteria bacterium]